MPLRQLYPDPAAAKSTQVDTVKVDIITVHGLNPRSKNDADHAWDTWRTPSGNSGRLWLRDDLPSSVPESRIFLYEYDARAVYGKDKVMGGLLIKQALINAHNNKKYTSIKDATTGLAFFATPHRGGHDMLLSLGGVAANIALYVGLKEGDNVIETLRKGGIFSDIMQEHWRHQLEEYNIISFWGSLDEVVPKESSRIGLPGDRENIVKLKADHSKVCKFGQSQTDQDNLKLVQSNIEDIYEAALKKLERQRKQDRSILSWLTQVNYAPQQRDLIGRRAKGTGQWLLNSAKFKSWRDAKNQSLFFPGIPGAGKTILTSVVVDHLNELFQNRRTGIAYIYCNFKRQNEQKLEDLLANLLKQLTEGQFFLPDDVRDLYDRFKNENTRPSIDHLSRALKSVAILYSRIFIVVDALDECQLSGGTQETFLSELINLQERCKANLFVTSRFDPNVTTKFDQNTWQEIQADKGDIERYLESNMQKLAVFSDWTEKLKEDVKTEISDAVDGMFLLAQIYLWSLEGKTTTRDVRSALKRLRRQIPGSTEDQKLEVLNQAYNETMDRISKQIPAHFQDLAKKTLSWITCAKRPLTTSELQHALSIKDGDTQLHRDGFEKIDRVISVCMGMVTVDEESNIIRLAHYTTQEYLEKAQDLLLPDAEVDITNTCLTYLSFSGFQNAPRKKMTELEESVQSNVLYEYAIYNWVYHAREAPASSYRVVDYLNGQAQADASIQEVYFANNCYGWDCEFKFSGASRLHIASALGLEHVVEFLLDMNEAALKDARDRTPHSYTARNRHTSFRTQLLAKVASQTKLVSLFKSNPLDLKDNTGRTPLIHAVYAGCTPIVTELLRNCANTNLKDTRERTALSYAAEIGNIAIVTELLANGAMTDVKDKLGNRPLTYAAEKGHTAIVTQLLAKGAMIEVKDKFGRRPLSLAAKNGHTAIMTELLANGAMIEVENKWGNRPLTFAAGNGHTAIVAALLAKGATIDVKNDYLHTPLDYALKRHHNAVVQLLQAAKR
ncbi:hypothetical protein PEX2_068180 [Penicillium expansum]|uniref:Uncharacterized protein n=1 Tax=Penicillium expansum TaxID=27334 RepID=A0A0A2JUH9_PENEN|nr:hypothetical protein PEX2_068180 [Penicillium expansum]KGO58308.1 hypothetical protein PEX2_068180 [Penicillium expansum]